MPQQTTALSPSIAFSPISQMSRDIKTLYFLDNAKSGLISFCRAATESKIRRMTPAKAREESYMLQGAAESWLMCSCIDFSAQLVFSPDARGARCARAAHAPRDDVKGGRSSLAPFIQRGGGAGSMLFKWTMTFSLYSRRRRGGGARGRLLTPDDAFF